MKYLKVYEEFEHWEKIPANDWYKTFEWKNLPLSETEYDFLKSLCIDNHNYDDYELDYDYYVPDLVNPQNSQRDWKFTIKRFKKDTHRETGRKILLNESTLSIFKKQESKSSPPLYFLHYVYRVNFWFGTGGGGAAESGFYECDRFQDLFGLVKKHLGLT